VCSKEWASKAGIAGLSPLTPGAIAGIVAVRVRGKQLMSFLRRLLGGSQKEPEDSGFYLYVKCSRCGTPVRVRIDLNNDLSEDEGETGDEGYTLVKEIMDDRCFRLMRAELRFDSRRNELSREVEGGTFITREEWEELRRPTTNDEGRLTTTDGRQTTDDGA
jgi:hypothetical protein